jgi:hypothetical protein
MKLLIAVVSVLWYIKYNNPLEVIYVVIKDVEYPAKQGYSTSLQTHNSLLLTSSNMHKTCSKYLMY